MRHKLFALAIIICTIGCKSGHENDRIQKALDDFQLEDGLQIEVMAYEPLVIDPVAFAFDENRRMYVVEDRGYPDPIQQDSAASLGRIALLEDTNGDGVFDKRTEFTSGLSYPNGILPWNGGVFITCAPHIYYYKDTDGDGVADLKKTVLTGFNDTKTSQIRMSHPTLGLDGWVYITGGLNGGEITSPEHPDRIPVTYTAADGRFHPETFEFQVTGGKSQFGLSIDPYGHRFGTSNRHPVMQIVMEPWHLARNPHLIFSESVQNVSPVEAEAVVYPISTAVTTADYIPSLMGKSHAGTFTAASGLVVFNGTGLSPDHQGNIFICESAQNLVQRQIVQENGASFSSAIAKDGEEFLSSKDEWFRPVFAQHGPDGGLYIADMHRKVIDHPAYVPEEMRDKLDFESGKSDGRIYRVTSKNFDPTVKDPAGKIADGATNEELIAALVSKNEWTRATAFRLLIERKPQNIAAGLIDITLKSDVIEGKVRALWLLHILGQLSPELLGQIMQDNAALLREQAVQIISNNFQQYAQANNFLVNLADDPSARVRFYAAIALGYSNSPTNLQALAKIAAKDGFDKWTRAAVLSGISAKTQQFLFAFSAIPSTDPKATASVMQDLGSLIGNSGSLAECRTFFKSLVNPEAMESWHVSAMLGLTEGLVGRKQEFGASKNGFLYAINGAEDMTKLDQLIIKLKESASQDTLDQQLSAIALLGYTSFDQSGKVLSELLNARIAPKIQIQAISAIAKLQDPRGAELLTQKSRWKAYSPKVKPAALAALVSNKDFLPALFSAIEEKNIAAAEVPSLDRVRLIKSEDPAISSKATLLFKELEGGDRMAVYESYKGLLKNTANAKAGEALYQAQCSACHTYAGKGGNVGPDLSGVKNQPADALLLHIIVPNYEVYPSYQSVLVKRTDGSSVSGWVVSETENSLTIRTATGADEAILRKNIESLINSGLSLMPDGLEKTMSKEDMANLIAYLKKGNEE